MQWKFWVLFCEMKNGALLVDSHRTDLKEAEKRFDVLITKKLVNVVGYQLWVIRQDHKPMLLKSFNRP